jgi:hypothetical protein
MRNRLCFILFFLCLHAFVYSKETTVNKTHYKLRNDPIDVVFVSHPKDKETLEYAIDGIRKNGKNIGRVIVISSEPLSKNAEWFDEKKFPFNKDSIAETIAKGDKNKIKAFFADKLRGPGWYFQQLLKLYAAFVIPGMSSNVLVIDADTIFMNPVEFLNDSNGGLFCVSHLNPNTAYFDHAQRLIPGYKRIKPEVYSVCHHMLFQKPILKDLFKTVERHHKMSFWKAFCACVELKGKRGASEYELYYNHALKTTDQVAIRELKWANSGYFERRKNFQEKGYHFVSFHTYLQGIGPKI